MIKKQEKNRVQKHYRMRKNIIGTTQRPRLCVFRSNKHMYAQVIDDSTASTIVSASTLEKEVKDKVEYTDTIEAAKAVGELVAKRAEEKGIDTVVFDRGGYLYHGKVQALADAAREAGLKF